MNKLIKNNKRLEKTIKVTKSYLKKARKAVNSIEPGRVGKMEDVDKAVQDYFQSLADPKNKK